MPRLSFIILVLVVVLVSPCASVVAQDNLATEMLTNEKVVTMVQAGLTSSIIVNKIRTSKTNFNTATDELIKLKEAHVPDEVINAMINPTAGAATSGMAAVDNGYPKDVGVYLKKGSEWVEMLPEVVNWKTGGVMKSVASLGVVKQDVLK